MITQDEYRRTAAEIAHSVAVVTVAAKHGLQAITVNSFLDVSYDPPTMAISVYSGARMADALDSADAFTISVLTERQKGIAQWLGQPGQPSYGLLKQIETVPGTHGPAHIDQCLAYFELAVSDRLDIATHTLYAGTVMTCAAGAHAAGPLIYRDGQYLNTAAW